MSVPKTGGLKMWQKIEKLLEERHMSVYKLSKLTGIPSNTLYNYKIRNSVMPFINACKIADALNVKLDDLR